LACKTRRSRLPAVSHAGVAGRRRGFGSYRSHPWRFLARRPIDTIFAKQNDVAATGYFPKKKAPFVPKGARANGFILSRYFLRK